MATIPVIDIFAGPGGLGEGFSAFIDSHGKPAFDIRLSIENDAAAHRTLELRAFFRQFPAGDAPEEYYAHLRGELSRQGLMEAFPREASLSKKEAWLHELGPENAAETKDRISEAIRSKEKWVLIGGPPCQAYSLAGRSRNQGIDGYDESKDKRQTLYLDYLQILADHAPPVFVMENVKGLLSATYQNRALFERILADLTRPASALRREGRVVHHGAGSAKYTIHSLVAGGNLPSFEAAGDFVVKSEQYGIPQARHRVILIGVREDCNVVPSSLARTSHTVSASKALAMLPRLRSGLTDRADSRSIWQQVLKDALRAEWLASLRANGHRDVYDRIHRALERAHTPRRGRGKEFIECDIGAQIHEEWYLDVRLQGVTNHTTRAHIAADLHRYLFAATFAQTRGHSPTLAAFPDQLLPRHANVRQAIKGGLFADRFRVQIAGRPSTTITSHISKDGHYYIHHDPTQCRSLTVREAARLQTFPDNYFFVGGRTAQYVQVGNAVPPLLARQIAGTVHDLL